jgi:hypothetical protein
VSGLASFVGRIEAGETRTVVLSLSVGVLSDSVATVRLQVREANGFDAPLIELTVPTRAPVPTPPPSLPSTDAPVVIPPPVIPPVIPPAPALTPTRGR